MSFADSDDEWEFEDDHVQKEPAETTLSGPGLLASASSAGPALGRAVSYTITDEEDDGNELLTIADGVAEITCLSRQECEVMLPSYGYDADALVQAFFEDEAACRAKACCSAPDACTPALPDGAGPDDVFDCPVCFDEVRYADSDAMQCGHWACRACWSNSLSSALSLGPAGTALATCVECSERVQWRMWETHLGDDDAAAASSAGAAADSRLAKAREWKLRHFTDSRIATTPCPARGCGLAVTYPKQAQREIACSCGFRWCFKCRSEWHGSGLECEDVRAWNERTSPDAANYKWLKAFSKPCPKCDRPIQKNGGCLHMTCGKGSSAGCGYEFCWVCMEPWGPHGSNWFSCSRPKSDSVKEEEARAAAEKASLGKLHAYFDHYRCSQVRQDDLVSRQIPQAREALESLAAIGAATGDDTLAVRACLLELAAGHLAVKMSHVWAFVSAEQEPVTPLIKEARFRQAELCRVLDVAQSAVDEDPFGAAARLGASDGAVAGRGALRAALDRLRVQSQAVRRLVRNLEGVLGESAEAIRLSKEAAAAMAKGRGASAGGAAARE